MSSYRQSSYDPYAYEQPGRPQRPFNWVQWIGVALIVASIATLLAYFAGRAGFIAPLVKEVQVSTALAIIGSILVNSRREPGKWIEGEEQRARNRKILAITVLVCAVIIGAAVAIEFSGA